MTPDLNFNGDISVTVLVTDNGGLSDSQVFILTVNAVNDAPTIESISDQIMDEDLTLGIELFGNDIDGDVLTFTADAGSDATVSIDENNNLTITPNGDYNGTFTVTAQVSDGLLSSESISLSLIHI